MFKEKKTFVRTKTATNLRGLITPQRNREPRYTCQWSSFRIFRVGGIATRSQLWFPSSLSSLERLTLPTRGRAIQEKRDSENRLVYSWRVEIISCGLYVRWRGWQARKRCFSGLDAPTDADTRRSHKNYRGTDEVGVSAIDIYTLYLWRHVWN